jgi:hypothetical protein
MGQKALFIVFLQFVVFYTNQTEGIRTCDVEAKFIKVNTSETPGK